MNDSAVITGLHVGDIEAEWSIILSYQCLVPTEIMYGGPNRTCYCGEWNETEPYCKSKARQDSLEVFKELVLLTMIMVLVDVVAVSQH